MEATAQTEMDRLRNLEIDKTNIDEELCHHTAYAMRVGDRLTQVEHAYETAKNAHADLVARLDEDIRRKADGKITEAWIDREIQRRAEFQASRDALVMKKTAVDAMKRLYDQWRIRADLLGHLAYRQGQEMKHINGDSIKAAA